MSSDGGPSCEELDIGLRLVLFDGFGTTLHLDKPFERLRENLRAQGFELSVEAAEVAFKEEMAFYRERMNEASDEEKLADLRLACAERLSESLARQGHTISLSGQEMRDVMMDSISFAVFPDVEEAIDWCRRLGLVVGVLSNWDCSLPDTLERTGLMEHLDFAVVSAAAGVAKPNQEIFHLALEQVGAPGDRAVYIGDEWEEDVQAALQAGLHAVLLDRENQHANCPCARITSLEELPHALAQIPEEAA